MCLHRLFLGIRKWQQRAWCYLCSMVNIYICPTAWACCSLFSPFFFLVFSVTCSQIIEEEGGQRGGEATRKHYPTAYYFLNPSSTDQCLYYKTWETKQMLDANLGSARWNSRHEVSESTRCELLIDLNKQTSTVAKNKQTNKQVAKVKPFIVGEYSLIHAEDCSVHGSRIFYLFCFHREATPVGYSICKLLTIDSRSPCCAWVSLWMQRPN